MHGCFLRRTHTTALVSLLALSSSLAMGCAAETASVEQPGDEGASTEAITQVNHTKVKRQSIGNCWLYATMSWMEALNKSATDTESNYSESYLTYFHWFNQLANGAASDEISTGGSYGVGAELINRYGVMLEQDFIPEEADADMSARQSAALKTINAALKLEGSPLKTAVAARDRKAIRTELDKAWQLSPSIVEQLDKVFGPSVSNTIDKAYVSKALPEGALMKRAKDVSVKLKNPTTKEWKVGNLQEAIGAKGYSSWSARRGELAWNELDYPSDAAGRRAFQKRVQRALHDSQPVIISWFVDFNALDAKANFTVAEIARRGGAGHQGGHMTVLHDYQVENVPGFGTLAAGKVETRPEALEAALDDSAQITFFQIKNSWGGYRPDRWTDASIAGYHQLYTDYLNGPVKKCVEKDGVTDRTNCTDTTPLWDVVLPPGY